MRGLSKTACAVLDAVTDGLDIGDSRTIDNTNGVYMALHVDRLSPSTYSLAHYFKQHGDMVCDPDGVFLRTNAGWLPVALQLCTGHYTRAIELDDSDKPTGVRPKALAELVQFTTTWLRNISAQQGGVVAITQNITRNNLKPT